METGNAKPVVGQNIVVGSKKHHPVKILERPPHTLPPATWHLDPDLDKPGPLSKDQLETFFEDGYIFIEEFYKEEILKDVQADVEKMIENLAQRLFKAGKIKDLYADQDWTQRLLQMRRDFPDAPVILIKGGVLPVALQKLFASEKILDIAEQLGMGPDIALNPAWNLRGKMPSHEETVVPWHQDNSYWEPRIWDEQVLTVWVALVDATVENGCMQMMKGGHKPGKTASHTIGTTTSTWYTEVSEDTMAGELLGKKGAELQEGVDKFTVEAKAGSILIFPGTTPHRSLNSTSSNIRWSCDFRLHPKAAKRPGQRELDWFYGLKDSLLLRKDSEPDFKPDYSEWAVKDRTELQDEALSKDSGGGSSTSAPAKEGAEPPEKKLKQDAEAADQVFDTTIVGPWMDLWDLEEHVEMKPNQHLESYLESDPTSRDPKKYIANGHW